MIGLESKKILKKTMKFLLAIFISIVLFLPSHSFGVPIESSYPAASDYAKSEMGDVRAQIKRGYYFLNPLSDIKPNAAAAVEWYKKAAEQDDKYAQWLLGTLYLEGKENLAPDAVKAFEWFYAFRTNTRDHLDRSRFDKKVEEALTHAAKQLTPQEIASAKTRVSKWRAGSKPKKIGVRADRQDKGKMENWRIQAEAGNGRAQYIYAEFYMLNSNATRSYDGLAEAYAKNWVKRSAEAGYLPAMVAYSPVVPMNTPEQYEESIAWSRKSAEQGDKSSQIELADYYRNESNKWFSFLQATDFAAEAWFWQSLADRQIVWTDRYRGIVSQKLNSHQMATVEKRLRAWKPVPSIFTLQAITDAASKADFDSQMMLARFSLYGDSPERDFTEGYFWLLAAVKYMPEEEVKYFLPADYNFMKGEAENNLTPLQIAGIQKRVKNWKPSI